MWTKPSVFTRNLTTEDCWLWDGAHNNGYPIVRTTTTRRLLHRVVAKTPDNMEAHHTCGNKGCMNPEHVVNLSTGDHMRLHRLDEAPALCPQGHDAWAIRADRGHRYCVECQS